MQYLISFLEGVITFISPCLLPMLPIYISYFAGGGERNIKRSLTGALGFVAGFTIVFVALGALADCYATDNQVDKAIATFQKAADLADNISFSPSYLLSAGLLLEHQKKNDEALKIYQRIKANYPASYLSTPIQPQTGETVAPEIDKYIERVSK